MVDKSLRLTRPVLKEVMQNDCFCIVVADSHALSREALSALLQRSLPDAHVTEMSSVDMCLKLEQSCPSIILCALRPPYLKGLERMQTVRNKYPNVPLVVLSDAVDSRVEHMARARGANGVFHTVNDFETLLVKMRRVLDGKSGFSPEQVGVVTGDFRFTPRQSDVLDLLCRGKSNKEIGVSLNMSEFTVRSHVSAIFTILGTRNRTEAVLAGRSWVMAHPEPDEESDKAPNRVA